MRLIEKLIGIASNNPTASSTNPRKLVESSGLCVFQPLKRLGEKLLERCTLGSLTFYFKPIITASA